MPRPRHHPAAIAEVVLHNEPPAARSVAQLLSRADQVAASRRGRSGAQECRPSTPHYPLAAGRGAASGHQPQLLPAGRAAERPRPEQAPSCGRTHPLSPYLQRLAHRAAVANPPLVVRSVAPRRWADSPGAVEAVSYTHLRAHETDSYLVCRLLLE